MASFSMSHEGHTLSVETESIDVTAISEPDPNWTFTDKAGHAHSYVADRPGGPYPTLEYRTRHDHADDGECDADGDQEFCYPVLVCRVCGQPVKPGVRAGQPTRIPGLTTYTIDGRPVSKQAAEDFAASMRAERLASGQVCPRCEQPLAADRGHICSGMVQAPAVQTLVKNIRERGLNHVLAVLVGTDSARKMIRDAWVSLDRDDRET
jgi:hypothetical protein